MIPATTKPTRAILSTEEVKTLVTYVATANELPLDQAGQITGLAPEILRKLVRDGVLRGSAPYRVTGVVGTCDIDQARQIAARLEAARAPLAGVPILATEAASKYNFDVNSIYRWYKEGWIQLVRGEGQERNRYFDEGDIAFARALADLSGHTMGKRVFPKRQG